MSPGGHIHFRHTGTALRLTSNTPNAPILWSLDESAGALGLLFIAAAEFHGNRIEMASTTRSTRENGEVGPEDV